MLSAFLVLPMIIMIFFLSNLTVTSTFVNTQIFIILFMLSVLFLFIHLSRGQVQIFEWFQGVGKTDWVWIIGGFGAVLGVALITTATEIHPIISLFISGGIMFFVLVKTKTILAPIIVHGLYNSTVLLIQRGIIPGNSFLQSTAIKIPPVGFVSDGFNANLTDIIWQFTLVAPAEEMIKLAAAIGIGMAVVTTLRLDKTAGKIVGASFAITFWMLAHLIIALPS